MPKIVLNGKEYSFEGEKILCDLLRELNLPNTGLAVVINDSIIPDFPNSSRKLTEGDRVEIIRAVGGG